MAKNLEKDLLVQIVATLIFLQAKVKQEGKAERAENELILLQAKVKEEGKVERAERAKILEKVPFLLYRRKATTDLETAVIARGLILLQEIQALLIVNPNILKAREVLVKRVAGVVKKAENILVEKPPRQQREAILNLKTAVIAKATTLLQEKVQERLQHLIRPRVATATQVVYTLTIFLCLPLAREAMDRPAVARRVQKPPLKKKVVKQAKNCEDKMQ
mmetsp:Transcript_1157/g.1824  ORF Transcript_1157/g.1824 Transcript_1157/m.1824 type:complete len:219 (+) Transcript_1157:557-1213(+)